MPQRNFPLLLTERLRLREPMPADCNAVHAIFSFPEVTRFGNFPDAPKKARSEKITRWMCGAFAKGKGCAWIIQDRRSDVALGAILFNNFDKASKCAEIGYELHPSHWGKGLMSEAVGAVARCGFDTFFLNRIEAWTLPGNGASDRVLEKAGFRYEGTLRQKARFKNAFQDLRMFSRLVGDSADEAEK
ncbi:MAG TPA: GNAT family N-acetyltransferase [Methylosinus sp.]|jgi:ribosomal-protein-alanine N-acetyltransferase